MELKSSADGDIGAVYCCAVIQGKDFRGGVVSERIRRAVYLDLPGERRAVV